MGQFGIKNLAEDVPANNTILECRDTRAEHVASRSRMTSLILVKMPRNESYPGGSTTWTEGRGGSMASFDNPQWGAAGVADGIFQSGLRTERPTQVYLFMCGVWWI